MKLTSPNPSDSSQASYSPSSSHTGSVRRHPPSPTPSSFSPRSQTPDSPSSGDISASSTPIFLAAVVPLPIFRGLPGECPAAHLARFNRLFPSNDDAASLDTVSRNFPISLLDDAALWHELAVEPHPSMSWDETKSAFLRAFGGTADRARAELVSLRQEDGESITSYYLRMQQILKRWPDHGLPEPLVTGLFTDGLREEFHDWVMPRKPETLEEALSLAMDWEGAMAARPRREERWCGFCEGRHAEKECEARRRMSREWKRRADGAAKQGEGEEERLGRVVSIDSAGKRSQCQCWKHQCWKKYERSGSAAAARPANANAAAAIVPPILKTLSPIEDPSAI